MTDKALFARMRMLKVSFLSIFSAVLFCCVGVHVNAQGSYTLTNGSVLWFDGVEGDDDAVRSYPRAFDTLDGGKVEVHKFNKQHVVTEITAKGTVFLALDTTGSGSVAVVDSGDFSPLCVWQRSGNTGYYYQHWGQHYYYLVGTKNSLSVVKLGLADPREQTSLWYDWDFGAALQLPTIRDGVRTLQYFWLTYDTVGTTPGNGHWGMSCDSYERPETEVYNGYNPETSDLDRSYYCVREVGGSRVPTGQGALFLPVQQIDHEKQIAAKPAGKGLTGITLSQNTLSYGDEATVTPVVDVMDGGSPLQVSVVPAYTEYAEEVYRRGISLSWDVDRDADLFGRGGVPTVRHHYYYGSPVAKQPAPPAPATETLSVDSIGYAISNSSRRYLQIDRSTSPVKLRCISVPADGSRTRLKVTVYYHNGTRDTMSVSVLMSAAVDRREMPEPANGPVIHGLVAGGGRMADVGGNTSVTVHGCDSIAAVYGGNDIAGWVQGSEGATLRIGTEKTGSAHPVRIGSVYGGGNGHYLYRGICSGVSDADDEVAEFSYADGSRCLLRKSYWFEGEVYPYGYTPANFGAADTATWMWNQSNRVVDLHFSYDPSDGTAAGGNGRVPYLRKVNLTVGVEADGGTHNDYIYIDSLFGGAANAFVGIAADASGAFADGITITVNGGTMFAVFGGNNFGGGIANISAVAVNVNGTKLSNEKGIENTWYSGYGREFGIRHLYGGGNRVLSPVSHLTFTGGMVDTCFLGGNASTVLEPVGTVNCTGANWIYDNDSVRADFKASWDALRDESPSHFRSAIGRYNIRALFGGNNHAPMSNLATINLLSGGISRCYGGGNSGDMRGSGKLSVADSADCFAGWEYGTPASLGSLVKSASDSRIIVEDIYGGSRMANVKNSSMVWLRGGCFGNVYGGNDVSGDVGSETDNGAWAVIGENAIVLRNVYGGSNGQYHCNANGIYNDSEQLRDSYGNLYDPYDDYVGMLIPTHNRSNLYLNGGRVLGSAYGGGVMASVGFSEISGNQIGLSDSADVTGLVNGVDYVAGVRALRPTGGAKHGSVHFLMNGGQVGSDTHFGEVHGDGNAYGGGYLSSIYGLSYLKVKGTTTIKGSLYAGNDCLGQIEHFGAYSTPTIAASSFKASDGVTPLNVQEEGGAYKALYSAYVLVTGTPRIGCVYGSGNGAYNYDGLRPEYSDAEPVCMSGGANNRPRQSSTFIDINTSGGMIDTVFGGGNGVGVRDNVQVFFNSTSPSLLTVGTIFGGNNRDDMACVPNIILSSGKVRKVFGGGNAGAMLGIADDPVDVCGNPVDNVSSYVSVNDANVTIDTLFGGCRMADVRGMAYIDIRNTDPTDGINYVYGGNDISGTVQKNARIDISGGLVKHIYGGSNGRYDYDLVGLNDYNVYRFHSTHNAASLVVGGVSGEPVVDSTTVNLYGGTIESNVYGGSSMANCRATYVEVNDRVCNTVPPLALNISGSVYGGGEGYWEDLNAPHRGNVSGVNSATHVHMRHAETLSDATAYGGGRGGDVDNTYLYVYPTWDQRFNALYGGCWGSDVIGTAHLTVDGDGSEGYNATNVFGGNDFTGNVYRSVLTIGSGRYLNVYGAGNGSYDPEVSYDTGVYAAVNKHLTVPNNEYVEVNISEVSNADAATATTIEGNLYGGGMMGTCMTYKKNAERDYVLVDGRKVPDTAAALGHADDYTHIVINMHGGTIGNNIYAGAAGTPNGNWLVYGLKQVNMDGGMVRESVYGGSENVSDGYVNECDSIGLSQKKTLGRAAFTNTTLRPSSVLNFTGGRIRSNIYGGGYLGNIYGSVYINVGQEAIDECPLWQATINGEANAYASFKPVDMVTGSMIVQHSVYGGANWGSGVRGSDFTSPGVFGGETRIIVDGEGYNTRLDAAQNSLPLMNIGQALLGSGTSADGGDVYNRIDLRNYGGVNKACAPTRELMSIQRTDALWLNETAVRYIGSVDAVSAYLSQNLALNRIDTLNAIGYNVIDVDATVTNIGEARFYKHSEWPYDISNANLVSSDSPQPCTGDECGVCSEENPSLCTQLAGMHRKGSAQWNNGESAYTAFVVNNGINIDFINEDHEYSPIFGYAYIVAEHGTNAIITAMPKYTGLMERDGVEFGGFISVCSDSLMTISVHDGEHGEELTWCRCIYEDGTPYAEDGAGNRIAGNPCVSDGRSTAEFPYYNYSTQYRVWSIGNGVRRRYAVILAHSNPDTLYSVNAMGDTIRRNKKLTTLYRDTLYNFSIAHGSLALPPTIPGHYYKINATKGISVSDAGDGDAMKLVGMGYLPTSWDALDNKWYVSSGNYKKYTVGDLQEPAAHGALDSTDSYVQAAGVNYIYRNPGSYFGLMMESGANFSRRNGQLVKPRAVSGTEWKGYTTIEGSAHVEALENFSTAEVGEATNTQPELELYLLYNNQFSQTMLGTVAFTLDEYVAEWELDGNGDTIWTERNLGMPIEIDIKIQTLLQEFHNMEYDVLAMYNEGRSNKFSRKVILPSTLQHRELYLEGVEWAPTDTASGNGEWITSTMSPEPNYFNMTADSASIIDAATNNLFRMTIMPRENVANNVNTILGWHSMSLDSPLDLVSATGKGAGNYVVSKGTYKNHDSIQVTATNPRGIKIGELDGRSEAALLVGFNYDGTKVYRRVANKGYIGKVILTLVSYTGGNYAAPNKFTLSINVKTREQGDTIYVASNGTIVRGGNTLHAHSGLLSEANVGKIPSKYLTRLRDAFNPIIYQEGDVIAILDTVKIDGGTQLFIRGYDYVPVSVIRYSGHHKEFPGEQCVYRGPMIMVSGSDASLTARNIEFNGSMVSKAVNGGTAMDHFTAAQRLYSVVNPSDVSKYADTNCAFGPIIEVKNGGTMILQNGVVVENNYNNYSGDNSSRYGAINVNTDGKLDLVNNVTIKNNMSTILPARLTEGKTHPLNGAVYMVGGTISLLESSPSTAVLITDNYLNDGGSQYWSNVTTTVDASDKLIRYEFDTSAAKVSTYKKANVWLNRTPQIVGVTDQEMNDSLSCVITFANAIPVGTRIGISKWFPDSNEVKRDTIMVAYQARATHLVDAIEDTNFISDVDGYYMFYNYGVNTQYIYLQRCATFRYQQLDLPLALEGGSGSLVPGAPMSYMPLTRATCPTGGDTIVGRLQGGFFPYTYKWSGAQEQSRTTVYTNTEIGTQLSNGDTLGYIEAIYDTLLTSYVGMPLHENSNLQHYVLTATDATGHCSLTKNLDVTLRKRNSASVFDHFELTGGSQWTDADITADRNYPAVQVTPMVWADRSQGVIAARVENHDTIYLEDGGDHYSISDLLFCEGDIINLTTTPRNPQSRFLMWDFAPYYSRQVSYVVPSRNSQVVAYYGPSTYWTDTINSTDRAKVKYSDSYYYTSAPADANYVVTHNGDVHIYNEAGLAWFISAVNGLNGSQPHEYYANKVFLHQKTDGTDYDMKSYLWTPVGTRQHPFRGWFIGTGSDPVDTDPLLSGDYVVVKNVIVDEPGNDYVGFFGFIDTARVSGLNLEAAVMRGSQYVGTVAASSKDSRVIDCAIDDVDRDGNATINTILTTRYASGGLTGVSSGDRLSNNVVHAKYVGNAVYSGGVVGYGTATEISDNDIRYIERNGALMQGLYIGGVAGHLDGISPLNALFRKSKSRTNSVVTNNYVDLYADGNSQYVGGMVGYAKNTVIENNYVHGTLSATSSGNGVSAVLDARSQADRNYFEHSSASTAVGQQIGGSSAGASASFSGSGNRVTLSHPVAGVDNLTRALNRWVREHNANGENHRTWRSDLESVNYGYPLFGEPDMIPVNRELTLYGCDSLEWNGRIYSSSQTFSVHAIDSVEMIDSTLNVSFVVHHSTSEHYTDSLTAGEAYSGHGFSLTATETALLRSSLTEGEVASVVLSDTLSTIHGCDSVITLVLTFRSDAAPLPASTEVKVYPNPTTSTAVVEADGLTRVEVYENGGRLVMESSSITADRRTELQVSHLASGIYYLRVHAASGVTIQKLIKK